MIKNMDAMALLEKHKTGELTDEQFLIAFGDVNVFYSTPFGDHKDGGKKVFLLAGPNGTGLNPVFTSMEQITAFYEQAGRVAYSIMQGSFLSVLETTKKINECGAPIKMGLIVNPGQYGISIPEVILEPVIGLIKGASKEKGITISSKTADQLKESEKADIKDMLKTSDHEFVPHLSKRGATTQSNLNLGTVQDTDECIDAYFNSMISQSFILAKDGGRVVGFMSYIPGKQLGELVSEKSVTVNYVSTIVVRNEYRRRGLTTMMYKMLMEKDASVPVATRTWSTNEGHLLLLQKLGFSCVKTIPNDRGENIDTVYYLKER